MAMVQHLHAYETDKLSLFCGETGHYTMKNEPLEWILPDSVAGFQREIEDSRRSYMERVVLMSLVVEDSGMYQCGGRELYLVVEGKPICIYLILQSLCNMFNPMNEQIIF